MMCGYVYMYIYIYTYINIYIYRIFIMHITYNIHIRILSKENPESPPQEVGPAQDGGTVPQSLVPPWESEALHGTRAGLFQRGWFHKCVQRLPSHGPSDRCLSELPESQPNMCVGGACRLSFSDEVPPCKQRPLNAIHC